MQSGRRLVRVVDAIPPWWVLGAVGQTAPLSIVSLHSVLAFDHVAKILNFDFEPKERIGPISLNSPLQKGASPSSHSMKKWPRNAIRSHDNGLPTQ